MKSFIAGPAFTVVTWLLFSNFTATAKSMPPLEYKGCYDTKIDMKNYGPWTYQTSGYCQELCFNHSMPVLGLWKGSDCLCGKELPPGSAKVSDNECNSPCHGYKSQMCGGKKTYGVYLTGEEGDPPVYTDSPTSTAPSEETHASTNAGGETVIVTDSSSNSSSKKGNKSNTAGIAAGAVVGSVGFLAILGALFFAYRYKKRKAVEAEYHRSAAMNNNYSKPGAIPMSDSRFDNNYLAQRRQSNGSIDDDHDFSRRILQVTNPDR